MENQNTPPFGTKPDPRSIFMGNAAGRNAGFIFIVSVVLLSATLSVWAFLSLSTASTERTIESAKSAITEADRAIQELRNNRDVRAYELLTQNKLILEREVTNSEAQRYISELLALSRHYDLNISGFTYSQGKITTAASANGRVKNQAIGKVSAFIRDFRAGTGSTLFRLDPVGGVIGDESHRDFSISLLVNTGATAPTPGVSGVVPTGGANATNVTIPSSPTTTTGSTNTGTITPEIAPTTPTTPRPNVQE